MSKYPSWRYHKDGRETIVKDADQDSALGPGWSGVPTPPEDQVAPDCPKCAAITASFRASWKELSDEHASLRDAHAAAKDANAAARKEYNDLKVLYDALADEYRRLKDSTVRAGQAQKPSKRADVQAEQPVDPSKPAE
jgi:hypothetical protein